jgi:predicted O-linked N-acetylglucosamine transferase (SPINDLY family)
MDVKQLLAEAERVALAGDVLRADVLVQDVLRRQPEHPEALYMAGMFQSHTGNPKVGEGFLKRAVAADPKFELAFASLGAVQLTLNRLDDAIASLRQAVALDPEFAEAYQTLAETLTRADRPAEAAQAWRRLTEIQPDEPDAYVQAGALLARLGRFDEAVELWSRAIERFPSRADFFAHYAQALYGVRRVEDGLNAAEYAAQLDPKCAAAYYAIHQGYSAQRRTEDALGAMERLLDVRPDEAAAHCDRGLALIALGEVDAALDALETSIRLRPEAAAFASMLLMARQYVPGADPAQLYRQHLGWANRYARGSSHSSSGAGGGASSGPRSDTHPNDRDPNRPLRVGFVSCDFRSHPVADFTHALFEYHDRARYRFFAYSDFAGEDAVTRELRGAVDEWRRTAGRTDDEIERLIRADQIDILIDLVGHTTENRLLVFARRPAPVQITYVGYCDTTGLSEIDYVIGDAITDPPQSHQPYAERLLHMPGAFASYMPLSNAPAVNALPALSRGDGAVTFGSLHKLAKLSEPVIAIWSRVLHAVPASRMLMFRDALWPRPRRRISEMFARHGIDASRLDFRNTLPPSGDSMSVYNDIDIALDSFPWSGHTTACESMWMGVPMVTLRGTTHAGRMAASTITHAGRPQWVAENQDQFVSIAAGLAGDLNALAQVRRTLRDDMRHSRLCDGVTFAREFENLLRGAWKTWCERGR